jgi:hypothetical protein
MIISMRFRLYPCRNTWNRSLMKLGLVSTGLAHLRLDSWVSIRRNAPIVPAKLIKNNGLIPIIFTPPKNATRKAPNIGPIIPNNPPPRVSQKPVPVPRSSFISKLAQKTQQPWSLIAYPSWYAIIAMIIITQLWATP